MSKPLLPKLREATRLTQAGRLNEATALLQGLLGGAQPSDLRSHLLHTPEIVDAVAEDVTSERAEEAHRQEPSATRDITSSIKDALAGALRGLRVQGQTQPLGLKRAPLSPSEVYPSNGTFITKSFGNSAGQHTYKLYIPGDQRAGDIIALCLTDIVFPDIANPATFRPRLPGPRLRLSHC